MLSLQLYTIGHSTRSIEEFIALLRTFHINHLVDVRTIPKSRRVPWFNSDALKFSLAKEKIHYQHLKALGGLRHAKKDSINTGWHNNSFHGYADYMQTEAFEAALSQLNEILSLHPKTAIMCAEAVPWRCHRSLIADIELVRGVEVLHIMNLKSLYPHQLTAFAKVDDSHHPPRVYYPG